MTSLSEVDGGKPYVAGSLEPYKYEVFQQCLAATEAWNRTKGRLTVVPPAGPQEAMRAALEIVADLQSFCVAVGVLSDLFFPGKDGDQGRGERLRALYSVRPDSPLKGSRVRVRNVLVHIDERLDRWLKGQVRRVIGPVTIQPWEGPAPPPGDAGWARIVDNKNWRILALGEELDLIPLLKEVGRVSVQYPLEYNGPGGRVRLTIAPPK